MPDHRYRKGFRAKSLKPSDVSGELTRIKEEMGALTSEGVFDAAQPKGAVLHPEFVWDGKEAIRELGLIRARQIIRAVIEVKEDEPDIVEWTFVPHAEKPSGPGEYERTEVVVQNVDLYQRALTNLQRKFNAAAEALEELRHAARETGDADRLAAIGLAVQGFGAVREALAILK